MEAAKIEWERIESVFVEDQVYENINAPQWVDLLAPLSPSPTPDDDDVSWFCRSDCKHPRTADDFLNSSSSSSKLLRSVSVSKLIGLVDWTRREPILKRRGGVGHSSISNEDAENQDPNFSTPNRQIHYLNKAAIKSSAQKSKEEEEEFSDIVLSSDDRNKGGLKATQSAKDLFGGSKELLGKITEFCNELKKMASRSKDEEEKPAAYNPDPNPSPNNCHKPLQVNQPARNVLGGRSDNNTKERLPLLEMGKDRYEGGERSMGKEKPRKNKIKRGDGAENTPVPLSLNNMTRKEEDKLLSIRTNPPTPQGFSGTRDPVKTTPSKGPKSRLMEREIIEEGRQSKNNATMLSGEKQGRTVDMFWFLKPCTLSS